MRISLAAILLITLVLMGCTAQTPSPGASMEKKLAKNYYEFDKAAYEKALGEERYIFLDFYANWCPICQAEEPHIIAAMDGIEAENLVGFRVNYNDGDTGADEKALAKQYGITYQHTKIIISPNGSVAFRTLEQWNKEKALEAIVGVVKND